MKKNRTIACLAALFVAIAGYAQVTPKILGDRHAMLRLDKQKKYLLLPVEEKEEYAHIRVVRNNQLVKTLNCRLAVDKVDYFVPYEVGEGELLDISFNGNTRATGAINGFACWKRMSYSDTFDTKNVEKHRPVYHHTPAYGWMNDPNGMFYKDGTWHLCYQYNPYGSQWENMTWGHSTSTDLVHWNAEPTAITPDALGTIFSGCCVVDKNNTAGFGKDAIVAFYTSAGASQTQSMAYSTDGGKTFTKYENNPVITSNVPDFRDPHVFWNAEAGFWNMILAAGQQMSIYSSKDLKQWKHESDFGAEYGNHGGVWECPDLMKMKVRGTDKEKWMLICNINPGGPFGGSATQYFIGEFDGHKFTCEDEPTETKWMDYGKDHYATITFDNTPEGRHVGIAWMSNWQYANQVPTKQFRSANSIARDFGLFEYNGETYCSVLPAKEMDAVRGQRVSSPSETCEIVVQLKGDAQLTLRNGKGERVVITYDAAEQTIDFDRRRSGDVSFSEAFPCIVTSPTYGQVKTLRIFVDRSSIEIFDADGKMAMTNLVFPSDPYNKLVVKGKAKATVYKLKF
ncbi:MAG: DUF4980 domain-containing protein [Prevotellaceae bacterium]|nr:DUF4980 domain-containing protein [Prevotellaceae bacterium]